MISRNHEKSRETIFGLIVTAWRKIEESAKGRKVGFGRKGIAQKRGGQLRGRKEAGKGWRRKLSQGG